MAQINFFNINDIRLLYLYYSLRRSVPLGLSHGAAVRGRGSAAVVTHSHWLAETVTFDHSFVSVN